jgi:hypothetical protein
MSKYKLKPELTRITQAELSAIVGEGRMSLPDAQDAYKTWERMEQERMERIAREQQRLNDVYGSHVNHPSLWDNSVLSPRLQSSPRLENALCGLDDVVRGGQTYTLDGWRYDGYRKAMQYVTPKFGMEQWDFFCRMALPEGIRAPLLEWQAQVETTYLLATHGEKLNKNWATLTNAVRDIPKPDDLAVWPFLRRLSHKPWWLMHHVETLKLMAVEYDYDTRATMAEQARARAAQLEMNALIQRRHKLKPKQR